jgi:hypothetical protein
MSLTEERAIYLALELDRSWTEIFGVNPLDGTNYLDKRVPEILSDLPAIGLAVKKYSEKQDTRPVSAPGFWPQK